MHAQMVQHRFQLVVQLLLGHLVVRCVTQRQIAGPVHCYTIFRIGQVFGREPEIDSVVRKVAEQAGRERARFRAVFAPVHLPGRLTDHLDVAHRVLEPVHSKIEIDCKDGLLENGRIEIA